MCRCCVFSREELQNNQTKSSNPQTFQFATVQLASQKMGGCKCTFRDCPNTSLKKNLHFFHFPFRDMERCEKWAQHSNNMNFLHLPISQLRNKVVCQEHFRDPCFMNYRKDRLTKFAIPTIMQLESGEILDFDVPTDKKNIYNIEGDKGIASAKIIGGPTICSALQSSGSNRSKLLNYTMAPPLELSEIDVENGLLINETTTKPKLLNSMVAQPKGNQPKRSNDSVILTKIKVKKLGNRPQMTKPVDREYHIENGCDENQSSESIEFYEENEANEDQPLAVTSESTVEHQNEIEMLQQEHNVEVANLTQQLQDKDSKIAELEAAVQRQEIELKQSQQRLENQRNDNKRLLQQIIEQATQMEQKDQEILQSEQAYKAQAKLMKETSASLQPKPLQSLPPPIPQSMTSSTLLPKPKQDKVPLTKPQLFNGVRRYLNPSMVALLRMELFGDPERDYRPDEQEFSMELLNQSVNADVNVFDYMRSEWRFRLPPKNVVEQWIRKRQETDEGDNVDWDEC